MIEMILFGDIGVEHWASVPAESSVASTGWPLIISAFFTGRICGCRNRATSFISFKSVLLSLWPFRSAWGIFSATCMPSTVSLALKTSQ